LFSACCCNVSTSFMAELSCSVLSVDFRRSYDFDWQYLMLHFETFIV
jgi:hypothetical protein